MRGARLDRSLEARALAAMVGVGAALCAVGAVLAPHEDTPVVLNAAAAGVGTALAFGVLVAPARWRRHVADLALVTYVAVTTSLVAAAGTDAGAITAANGLLWFCLYVASFRSVRTARAWCAVATMAITGTVGLRLGGQAGVAAALVLSSSAVVGTELLSRIHDRLERLSTTDHLTGALNRAGLEAAVPPDRRRPGSDRVHTVAAIDLDGFKAVNDERGHTEGDRVLSDLVAAWRGELREIDIIARTGGDEFVLLLLDTDLEAAAAVLDRLRAVSTIGWSAGLARLDDAVPFSRALDEADARMYAAKLHRQGVQAAPVPLPADRATVAT